MAQQVIPVRDLVILKLVNKSPIAAHQCSGKTHRCHRYIHSLTPRDWRFYVRAIEFHAGEYIQTPRGSYGKN